MALSAHPLALTKMSPVSGSTRLHLGREQTVWFKVLQGRSSYSRLVATDLREHNDSNILEISIDFVRTKSISKFIERCRA
jgi:hypothetical protein